MIDVLEELKKYSPIDMNNEAALKSDDMTMILENVTKAYDRIGKEQFKSSAILEELTEIIEEDREKENQIRDMRLIISKYENKSNKLLKGLLDINDAFEDMYLYILKLNRDNLKEAMDLQREKNIRMLSISGVTLIGSKGDRFDSNIYIAKELGFIEDLNEGDIIEVLRLGYIYEGQIIRKAEVIVNKKSDFSQGGI